MIGIDIGNTLTKIYELNSKPPKLIKTVATGETIPNLPNKPIIIASVNKHALNKWKKLYPTARILTHNENWSFSIDPRLNLSTVGIDRLLAINGISTNTALVVMLGTATVINVIIENTFIGGSISPGIEAMYKGLTEKAPGLKLFKPTKGHIIGKTSQEAIYSGIYYMQALWIDRFNSVVGNLPIIYTGGSYHLLKDILPKGTYIPHLVAIGMQKLLLLKQ